MADPFEGVHGEREFQSRQLRDWEEEEYSMIGKSCGWVLSGGDWSGTIHCTVIRTVDKIWDHCSHVCFFTSLKKIFSLLEHFDIFFFIFI